MTKDISIVIPTLNGGELFHRLLNSILDQEIDARVEVVVVDSGSTDETVRICNDHKVKLIPIPSSSFSHGPTRNAAISAAAGEICVLTVQDGVPVDRHWLAALVEPLRHNDRLAGVFGQQVSCPGASALSRCCKKLWYQEWREDWASAREQLPIDGHAWAKLSPGQKRKAARFDNVNSCIRKSVWREVPFPDVPYGEDIAWAADVLRSGRSILWQPRAKMFHSHERSLAYELKRSYVDMKNLAEIFGECSSGLELDAARAVVDWLYGEVRRYLADQAGAVSGGMEGPALVCARGDDVWQRCRKDQTVRGKRWCILLSCLFKSGKGEGYGAASVVSTPVRVSLVQDCRPESHARQERGRKKGEY